MNLGYSQLRVQDMPQNETVSYAEAGLEQCKN